LCFIKKKTRDREIALDLPLASFTAPSDKVLLFHRYELQPGNAAAITSTTFEYIKNSAGIQMHCRCRVVFEFFAQRGFERGEACERL
jgi:hypothetical protein